MVLSRLLCLLVLAECVFGLPMNMDKRVGVSNSNSAKKTERKTAQTTKAGARQTLGTLSTTQKVNHLFFKPPFPEVTAAVPAELVAASKKLSKEVSFTGGAMDGLPKCNIGDVKKAFASMLTVYQRTRCNYLLGGGVMRTGINGQDVSNQQFKDDNQVREYMDDYTWPFTPRANDHGGGGRAATLAKHILNAQNPKCKCLSDIPTISYEAQQTMNCDRKKDDSVDKLIQNWNVCNGRTYTGYEVPQVNPMLHPFAEMDATMYSKDVYPSPIMQATGGQ